MKKICILLFSISFSKAGITISFSSSSIPLSLRISATFVLAVKTVISYPFEKVIVTFFMLAFPAITDIPKINIVIKLIITIFFIEIDAFSYFFLKIIIPP